ncbi:hypothetical protein ACFWNT_01755 [Streptomyces sp. NPDC058409]|uniref:hypothetical protein n=1 Tax=Streptomyces sp. NPDC058409 TaxID=3346484 RepID=UPI003650E3BB
MLFNPVVDLCGRGEILDHFRAELGLDPRTAARLAASTDTPRCAARDRLPGPGRRHHPARWFRNTERAAGADCRLVEYTGAPHGFFNPGSGEERWFEEPVCRAVAFVTEQTENAS